MYSDESKPSALATKLSEYDYVVLDTCSLMEDAFPQWLDTLAKSKEYWKEDLQILVPKMCLNEVKKHARDRNKEHIGKRIAGKRAHKVVKDARRHRILTLLKGEKDDKFADSVIYNFANKNRIDSKVLIITQDKTLAYDLRQLNHLGSQKGRYVDVEKITADGSLAINYGEKPMEGNRTYGKPSGKKPFGQPRDNKPSSVPSKKEEDPIIKADIRLSANLDNPNYPIAKKVADIKAQLAVLGKLPKAKLDSYSLAYTVADLNKKLSELGEKPVENKPADRPTPEVKPAAKAEEKPERVKAPASGKSVLEAVSRYCAYKGVIVRDDGVGYFEMVHGPHDIVRSELTDFVGKIPANEKVDYTGALKGLEMHVVSSGKFFDVFPVEAKKPEAPKPVEKPAEPKPQKAQKAAKVEAPSVEVEGLRKVTGSNRKLVQATPRTVVPKGATLIVGVPENEKVATAIERKSKRLDTPKEVEASKPEGKKAASKKAAPKGEPKKEAPKKPESEALVTAKKAELRLMANLGNPNYALKNKLKDVTAQIDLLHGLSQKERGEMKLGLRELRSKESELKKEVAKLP